MKARKAATTDVQWRLNSKARPNAWCVDTGLFVTASHEAVSRSLHYMVRNFTRPIQLEAVVKVSGMSRRGFYKAFNKDIGQTPVSILRQMRIEYAKQLLLAEDLPLKIIASRTGFRSENTFCVAFQRAMGMAPKKYQRQVWLAERRNQQKSGIPSLQMLLAKQNNWPPRLTISNHH